MCESNDRGRKQKAANPIGRAALRRARVPLEGRRRKGGSEEGFELCSATIIRESPPRRIT